MDEIEQYRLDAVDENSDRIEEYSLASLMSSCIDFSDKLSKLERIGKEMGVEVMTTTNIMLSMLPKGLNMPGG